MRLSLAANAGRRGGSCQGREASRPTRLSARLPVLAGSVLVMLLVAYHGLLFWQRLTTLTLIHPVVALRWLATVGFLYALLRLRRSGVSLLRGRKAIVFWLLVLLLHVSFSGPLAETPESALELTPGSGLLLALPATGPVVVVFLVLLRLALASHGRQRCSATHRSIPIEVEPNPSRREGWLPQLSCRPPPPLFPSTA